MIEFLNPFLLGGLAAVSVPVIIHLLHRRKIKLIDWGAMRFLLEMLAKRRRRLFMDELLLLLIRALIVACVALAMLRPSWSGSTDLNALRKGRTASVLLVDDSLSTSAGRAQPAVASMKKLGQSYIDSLLPGDEVSLIIMSRLREPAGDPVFDLEAVSESIGKLEPSTVATDIPALLEAGMDQLKRCINPSAELVLLTDGRKDGWQVANTARWEGLRERLRGPANANAGTRQRPRVIVLSPPAAELENNLSITDITTDQAFVAAGKTAGVRVQVSNSGARETREATVQLTVGGQAIGSKHVEVPAAGHQEVLFEHVFEQPGSYGIEARLLENRDLLPTDDERAFALNVEASVPVLLVEDGSPEGLETRLGFLHYALNPQQEPQPTFRVTRTSLAQLLPSTLPNYRVVVIGDVRTLEPSMIDALERFVVGGGGLFVGLGPNSDPAHINRFWARGGDGFLPSALGRVQSPPAPPLPASVHLAHPVFTGFSARNDQAWKAARVRSYYQLDPALLKRGDAEILLRLDNGDPLLVERRRGLGLVQLFTSSLNPDWTELPLQAAYVPLMRGVAGHLGNFIIPPRNIRVGEPIIYARWEDPAQKWTGEDPHGKPLELSQGAWEGRTAVVTPPLLGPGLYTIHGTGKTGYTIHYSVAVAPAETQLQPNLDSAVSPLFDRGVTLLHTPEQIAEKLDPARRKSVEFWQWLIAAAVVLLFIEAWFTRRESLAPAKAST